MHRFVVQGTGHVFNGSECEAADVEVAVVHFTAEDALREARELPACDFHSGLVTDEVVQVDRDSLQVFED